MSDLVKIFRFGWPYLRRYWFRLFAGILLGVLFGISMGSFVVATQLIVDRLTPKSKDVLLVPPDAALNISVLVSTNVPPGLVVTSNSPALTVSRDTSVRVVVKTNISVPTLISKEELERMEKLEKHRSWLVASFSRGIDAITSRAKAAVDPWLPSRDHKITVQQVIGGFLLLPLLMAFRGFIGYLSSYCMAWVSERVIRDLRMDLLTKLNSLSMDYFNRATIGELLARVNGDTGALYRCLSLGFSDLIKEPISVISILITLLAMDWKLTLMAVVFTPLTLIPVRILGKKVRKSITSTMTAGMSQDSLLVEVFSSIRVVKAFCLEKMQLERFRAIYSNLVSIGMKSTQARELVNPIVETISALGMGVVIVFIFYHRTEIPELMGFLTGVTLMYTPIKKLGNIHLYFQQAGVGATRMVEIFNEQPTVKEKPDAQPLPEFKGEIKFENVSFAYPPRPGTSGAGAVVIRDLSLRIPRGLKLGLAGETGSGKSSLVNLVFRFYDPTKGRILIDGHDLRDLKIEDLRKHMALVSQDIVIFDQTVAENIACGRPGATREEVVAAAKAASADDFIRKMPKGYDTRVGEQGKTLSGGQKQRICIARAFIRDAPILVLDEATASLDAKVEAEVQGAIDRLAENRTVICIAHRLSTLSKMDHIVVLKDGQVVEQDSFAKLIKANGIFADMARRQGITPGTVQ